MVNNDIEQVLIERMEEIKNFLVDGEKSLAQLDKQREVTASTMRDAERDMKRCGRALQAIRGDDESDSKGTEPIVPVGFKGYTGVESDRMSGLLH